MKNYFFFLCLSAFTSSEAQNFFAFLDNTTTQSLKTANISDVKENYYSWQWLGLQFKNGTGLLIQASQEPMVNTLVAGYFVSKTFGKDDRNYIEIGLSGGREWNKENKDCFATSGYIWYENYPEKVRRKGKIMLQVSPYYSKFTGYWVQGFALISPIKSVSLGAYFQTGGTIGPRAQVNLPGTFSLWISKDLSQIKNNPQMTTIGLQFINVWNLNKKVKNPDAPR